MHTKSKMLSNGPKPTLLMRESCGESGGLNTSLTSLAFKLCERQREELRYFLQALPDESTSWHGKFVKKLASEDNVENVRVNIDDVVNTATCLSEVPMITTTLNELPRRRKVLRAATWSAVFGQINLSSGRRVEKSDG